MTSPLTKRPLPLYALDGGDPALDFAHRWWRARCDDSQLPSRAAVDSWAFRLLVGGTSWIDVRSPEPADWRMDSLAAGLGKLASAAWDSAAAALRVDLEAIRRTGVVLVQDLFVAGRRTGWRQLVLPHADDGVRVQDLLVVVAARPTAAMARRGAAATGWRR